MIEIEKVISQIANKQINREVKLRLADLKKKQ